MNMLEYLITVMLFSGGIYPQKLLLLIFIKTDFNLSTLMKPKHELLLCVKQLEFNHSLMILNLRDHVEKNINR